jgi:hypothetical protein
MTKVMNDEEPKISMFHRALAAAGASLVSAVVVNPLDVVKVSFLDGV